MMNNPNSPQWRQTIDGLHQAVRILGALQLLTQPETALWLERALAPVPVGASTGRLPGGGRVLLDFQAPALRYQPVNDAVREFPLNGRSQRSLLVSLFETIAEPELRPLLPAGDDMAEQLLLAYEINQIRAAPKAEALLSEQQLDLDVQVSAAYGAIQFNIFTVLARFRARLMGSLSPVVLWPEHFDLSTIWFVGRDLDEEKAHINFGFAPFSPGLEFPYLYAYAYPYPEAYEPPPLPSGARWHSEGWTGVVLPYSVIAEHPQPEQFTEESCLQIFQELRALLAA